MATDLKTVESYWSLEEAEIARGFLASEGIQCQLDGTAIAGNFWHLNVATGGVKLKTLEQDADRATALLHGIEHHTEFGPDDNEDFSPEVEATIEDSQDGEDSDASESDGILDILRRQKWVIIVAFIVLIVCGVM